MKKKIVISVLLIGFIVALTSNSWAQRERGGDRRPDRGGRIEEFNRPADKDFDRDRDRGNHTRRDFNRPGPRFKHKLHKGRHYRPAYRSKHKFHRRYPWGVPKRLRPKYRHWRHRPVYRHGHPRPFFRRNHHSGVNQVNNYYSNTESYSAPEDEFSASATISDTGFSVSVGVRVGSSGVFVFVTVTMTGVGEYMDGVIVGGGAGKVGTV